jgi:hypothetical protein
MTASQDGDAALGGFEGLLAFPDRLEGAHVHYGLLHTRDSVMVDISLPGWRWEVEFMSDGTVAIERYRSLGEVETDPTILEEIFES